MLQDTNYIVLLCRLIASNYVLEYIIDFLTLNIVFATGDRV